MKDLLKTITVLLLILNFANFYSKIITTKAVEAKVEIVKETIVPTTITQKDPVIQLKVETSKVLATEVKTTPTPVAIKAKKIVTKKTAPVAKKAPSIKPVQVDKEYVKKRICEVFGPAQCANALIIAKHESGYRTNALSPTNDYGVFQINCRWQKHRVGGNCNNFYDLETNLRIAKQIFNEQGWSPWYSKKYLPK